MRRFFRRRARLVAALIPMLLCWWVSLVQAELPAELPPGVSTETMSPEEDASSTFNSQTIRGEEVRDPLAGLFFRNAQIPTEEEFWDGVGCLGVLGVGISFGWWWRRRELFPSLAVFAGLTAILTLISVRDAVYIGFSYLLYAFLLGRFAAWVGGRTGGYFAFWAVLSMGPMAFMDTSPSWRFLVIPLVHLFFLLMIGCPILLIGGVKRALVHGLRGILASSSPPSNQALEHERFGCLARLGFFGCFVAGVNVLGVLSGALPLRAMLAAPRVFHEEFKADPHRWKYVCVHECPMAIPESSFELSGTNEDGKGYPLERLLIPMAPWADGQTASTGFLISSKRRLWIDLFLRARSKTVDPDAVRPMLQPEELTRFDQLIQKYWGRFYPRQTLLLEVPPAPTPVWSPSPVAGIPTSGAPTGGAWSPPRPGGLVEPFVKVIDHSGEIESQLFGFGLMSCFLFGCLILWKSPTPETPPVEPE